MATAVESIQACFHPSLAWTVKLAFKCGSQFRQFMATHDYGGVSYEYRHFIDEHLWNQLREESPELDKLVKPHPPTSFVYNRKSKPAGRDKDPFLPVKGMLKSPLKLSFIGSEAFGLPTQVVLTHVLVVENLPVPFHINSKVDGIYQQLEALKVKRDDVMEKLMACSTGEKPMSSIDMIVGVKKEGLKKEKFPRRYHSHPYWVRNTDEQIQSMAVDPNFDKMQQVLLAAMEESLERGERDGAAAENGWEPIPHKLGEDMGQESWFHPGTGDRIDYYPRTDHCKTTLKIHPKDAKGNKRGKPYNKDLVRDDVGGTAGLRKIFRDVRTHTGNGRYWKEVMEESLERRERDAAAVENGWQPIPNTLGKGVGQESWFHPGTGDRIDYYPSTDRCKTTLKILPKEAKGKKRSKPFNKELVTDNVGGTVGLGKIFKHAKHFKIIVKVGVSLNLS